MKADLEQKERHGTINLKGICEKKPTSTDGGGIIQFGYQQDVPGNIRRNLEPWEQTGQRQKKIVINAKLSGSKSKDYQIILNINNTKR